MNRTDRLYALVEELRAVSPRPRTAAWLARRFDVTARTIERDLQGLRASGVAIRGDVGRAGGYSLDRDRTLPPVTLTAEEALAISVALHAAEATPFAAAARRAAHKVLAVLPVDVRRDHAELLGRVHRVGAPRDAEQAYPGTSADVDAHVAEVVRVGARAGRVLRLDYVDASGRPSRRDVEPLGLLWGPHGWYLVAWCRLRCAVRGFGLHRITAAELRDERVTPREHELLAELERVGAQPVAM